MSYKVMKRKPIYIFKCWSNFCNSQEDIDYYESAKVVKCYTKIGIVIKKSICLFLYDYCETVYERKF